MSIVLCMKSKNIIHYYILSRVSGVGSQCPSEVEVEDGQQESVLWSPGSVVNVINVACKPTILILEFYSSRIVFLMTTILYNGCIFVGYR